MQLSRHSQYFYFTRWRTLPTLGLGCHFSAEGIVNDHYHTKLDSCIIVIKSKQLRTAVKLANKDGLWVIAGPTRSLIPGGMIKIQNIITFLWKHLITYWRDSRFFRPLSTLQFYKTLKIFSKKEFCRKGIKLDTSQSLHSRQRLKSQFPQVITHQMYSQHHHIPEHSPRGCALGDESRAPWSSHPPPWCGHSRRSCRARWRWWRGATRGWPRLARRRMCTDRACRTNDDVRFVVQMPCK